MRISADANTLTISETPGALWLFGLFFAAIGGAFVYGGLGGFSNWGDVPLWQNGLAALMGLAGVAAGISIVVQAPATRLVADRESRRVTITRRGLGSPKSEAFSFDEIRHFLLLRDLDDEGDSIWTFSLRLTNDEVVRIGVVGMHSEDFERRFVFEANEFIGRQLGAAEMVLEEDAEDA